MRTHALPADGKWLVVSDDYMEVIKGFFDTEAEAQAWINAQVSAIKAGDVFNFAYSEAYVEKADVSFSYLRHCFDGQLVATKYKDGELRLVDTYWGDESSRSFTEAEARERGTLTFQFNLNEVEPAFSNIGDFYDLGDWFNFSSHHGCKKRFVKRKGAQRSKARMLETVAAKLRETHQKLASVAFEIERLGETKARIAAGDLDGTYIG